MHYSPMAHLPPVIMFFFISHLLLLTFSTQAIVTSDTDLDTCPSSISFECGSFNSLVFPFTNTTLPGCGLCTLSCNKLDQTANISCSPELPAPYQLVQIDTGNKTILTNSPSSNKSDVCNSNTYISPLFSSFPSIRFSVLNNQTYVKCQNGSSPLNQQEVNRKNCPDGSVVYGPYTNMSGSPETASSDCRAVYISPTNNISVQYQLSESCRQCVDRGGWCYDGYSSDKTRRISECTKKGRSSKLGIVLGSVAAILFVIIIVLLWRLRMIKRGGFTSKPNTTLDYSESDLEINTSVHYGVPVFSYNDLREATNHFDAIKEVGEGGFGTVYQGKLKDGREVAVKRLYEKNYKRIEQFINEIRLLTSLRHKNLVTLYGCTSQHSRELLLVYEYVPNGTVADHLHGGRAEGAGSRSQLTWPVRMKIAIETASALSYLHACDIVHRDVKTDNILLDNHFSVKVADFGLSRLFPLDVTHVSTAPQGTPGYVDPEYHQCFQLTDKSDVYSFGVVLIELLSSLPALDMKRDKHEISLATYAINRIKCCAFSELVDSGLGYDSDFQVRRMTMLVAELAFQCLQHQKELRPSMDQVLETLQSIENADYSMLELEDKVKLAVLAKSKSIRPLPLLADDKVGVVELLSESARYLSSSSPDSVMNIWRSGNTTPSTNS